MAKGNFSGLSCIKEHLDHTYRKSKEETRNKYAAVLYNINTLVRENGYSDNPREYDEETIQFIVDYWNSQQLAVSTKDWYKHILGRYLKYFKNDVIEQMGIDFGQDYRPNVNWLSEEERDILLACEKTPIQELVVHLELCLGLRIIEVIRLRMIDVHISDDPKKCFLSVRGKGKGDGKWRNIPFHPLTKEVLARWYEERNRMITKMHSYDPTWRVPDELVFWCHYDSKPAAAPYTDRGHSLDRAVMHELSDRLGFYFSNHTLRRTFGRTAYRAGIPIETIAKIFGHSDIKTTVRYLGIDLDDMGAALSKMYDYQYGLSRRF